MLIRSSQTRNCMLTLFFLLTIFFIWMDVNLYIRIHDYPIRDNEKRLLNSSAVLKPTVPVAVASYETSSISLGQPVSTVRYDDVTWVSCDLNPLCDVTAKAMILDHVNHYLFAPMVTIADNLVGISRGNLITPNMISIFHVFVAIASGRMIASDSLSYRRIGVVLFEFRTFLDDLDGHVARDKKHVHGERSDIGSLGFYIDAICDVLGVIALMIGVFIFLTNNLPRTGYTQLQSIIPTTKKSKSSFTHVNYNLNATTREVVQKVSCYSAIWVLSGLTWNRYIAIYQDVLEREDVTPTEFLHQESVFRSIGFFVICWVWRMFNVHALLHFLLLSIFCDKLWEYLRMVQYAGLVMLLVIISVTEMHFLKVKQFICKSVTV
ncbi:ceramide phosphoethanolamine synthase-like [Topomyia yanbarensis]|uniref:ceramide phosphoethanolamine synthase-like n=1 Tax=Topomyia yanbarensis TaxID=2498891 RepID=UPI00273C6830|nr:ceramide phosphoethanolamine synthase-like [Topomyia yanbarensis]